MFDCRIGGKSSKLVRAAALKLAQEIAALIERPSYTMVSRALEGCVHRKYITVLFMLLFYLLICRIGNFL